MTMYLLFIAVCLLAIHKSLSANNTLEHTEINSVKREQGDADLEEYSPLLYKQYINLVSAEMKCKIVSWVFETSSCRLILHTRQLF